MKFHRKIGQSSKTVFLGFKKDMVETCRIRAHCDPHDYWHHQIFPERHGISEFEVINKYLCMYLLHFPAIASDGNDSLQGFT